MYLMYAVFDGPTHSSKLPGKHLCKADGPVMLERRDVLCREMLRIKRSVAASFSQVHYNTTIVDATTAAGTAGMACCSVAL